MLGARAHIECGGYRRKAGNLSLNGLHESDNEDKTAAINGEIATRIERRGLVTASLGIDHSFTFADS